MATAIRPAAVAGSWYPGEAVALAKAVEHYLSGVVPLPESRERLVGLVSPHAGLVYSGPVAAWGYSLLRGGRPLTVVLVGPSHHEAFAGVAVADVDGFETPLGVARVDGELAVRLRQECDLAILTSRPHREEHCLEMQLPFLQCLVPELRILPLLMGCQSKAEVEGLACALARILAARDDVLLVASSDLSHYHSAETAHRLDGLVAADIERFDDEALLARLESTHGHACGGGAIVTVMKASRALGAHHARVLRYGDSGDAGQKDKHRVVGYLSAALLG